MGGGSSKVEAISQADEPVHRVGSAGDAQSKLTLISLNIRKLNAHVSTMDMLAGKFLRVSEEQVQQNQTYTKSATVSQVTLDVMRRTIDDMKHVKRLTLDCRAALEPLDTPLDELILAHEIELREMQAQIAGQQHARNVPATPAGANAASTESSFQGSLSPGGPIETFESTSASTAAPTVDLLAHLEVVEEATATINAAGGVDADSDGTLFTAGSSDSPVSDGSAASARARPMKATDLEEDFEEHPS